MRRTFFIINLFLTLLCVSVFSTACGKNNQGKHDSQKENISTHENRKVERQEKNRTDSFSNNMKKESLEDSDNSVRSTSQNEKYSNDAGISLDSKKVYPDNQSGQEKMKFVKSSTSILIYLLLLVLFVIGGLLIYLIFKMRGISETIDEKIESATYPGGSVYKFVNKEIPKDKVGVNDLNKIVERNIVTLLEKKQNNLFELFAPEIAKLVKIEVNELRHNTQQNVRDETGAHIIEKALSNVDIQNNSSNIKTVYLPSVQENGYFGKETDEVTDTTVYELYVSQNVNTAKFDICRNQKIEARLLEVKEFLNYGADVQRVGNQRIVTEEKGLAEKQSNGKWKVVKEAKLIFE